MTSIKLLSWTTATAGAAALTLWCTEAHAFFPPLPLASDGPITITNPPAIVPILINPIDMTPVVISPNVPLAIPPVSPPPFTPPPPPPNVPQVVPPCVCVNPPQNVPEPTTLAAAAIGLATLVAVRKRHMVKA